MMCEHCLWLAHVGRTVKDETPKKTGWRGESREVQA